MKFHLFGKERAPIILLLHGIQTPWQIWQKQIEFFQNDYQVIVPALNGHEEDNKSEFESLEKEVEAIENYFIVNDYKNIFAVCGISMGGVLAYKLWISGRVKIHHLVMDGAPLTAYNKLVQKAMTKQYLAITYKARKRDKKTIENFSKFFLPSEYLESYLKIADNMSDQTIRNLVASLGKNELASPSDQSGEEILYLYGTESNELFSKKTAKQLKRNYPNAVIIKLDGYGHTQKMIDEPDDWLKLVDNFISRNG